MKRVLLLLVAALAACGSDPEGTWATVPLRAANTGPKYFTEQHGATARLRLVADTSGSVVTSVAVSVNDGEGRGSPSAPAIVVEPPVGSVQKIVGTTVVVTFETPLADGAEVVLTVTVAEDAPQPWRCLVVPSMRAP